MAKKKILVVGAGALAVETIELVKDLHIMLTHDIGGVFVDHSYYEQTVSYSEHYVFTDLSEAVEQCDSYIMALADMAARSRMIRQLNDLGMQPIEALIHPLAKISPRATIGLGTIIAPFAYVGPYAVLGQNCFIMHLAHIGHNVEMQDNVVVCPSSNLAGYAKMGSDTFVGASGVVAPRVQIGERCFIAAGAACLKDFDSDKIIIGNPSRALNKP